MERAFRYEDAPKNPMSVDAVPKKEKKSSPSIKLEESQPSGGMDFSSLLNNHSSLSIPTPSETAAPKQRKKRNTSSTNLDDVVTETTNPSPEDESYEKKYEGTTSMLMNSVAQLDAGVMEMQGDVNLIRASKTLKRKYEYLSAIQGTIGQYIGTKVSALREINSTITKCNELELKRAKELRDKEGDQNTDKAIMDMYNAFISMPTDLNSTGMPTVSQLTLNPAMTGISPTNIMGDMSEEAGMQNYLNNMSPAQRLSMYEQDPNVQEVVVYDNTTGARRFEVMNVATGEIIPNVDKHDMMFMEDTVLDLNTHVARNLNLNESFPIIEVGERLADAY